MKVAIESGSIAEALHAADYAMYAYLQMGKESEAKAILEGLPSLARRFDPAALEPGASAWPHTEAMTWFARALGAAHSGDFPGARSAIDSLASIRERLIAQGEGYWAEQVAIQHLGAGAWLDFAEQRETQALARMREAADREDATEKSAVTPGLLAPARELLGDMLAELNRSEEARAEYRAVLRKEPNRRHSLLRAGPP